MLYHIIFLLFSAYFRLSLAGHCYDLRVRRPTKGQVCDNTIYSMYDIFYIKILTTMYILYLTYVNFMSCAV